MSKDSDTVLVCRPTTLGVGKHSERGYGRTLSASKIRPSNAVSGNTVCTFPSCRGSWRHRWLILIKMDYSSEAKIPAAGETVAETWASDTGHVVAMMSWMACKVTSINSNSSSNGTGCRRQIGRWIRSNPDLPENRTVCVMR